MPQFQRARCRGVTQSHHTRETGEQRRRAAAPAESVEGRGLSKENTPSNRYWSGFNAGTRTACRSYPGRVGCPVYDKRRERIGS